MSSISNLDSSDTETLFLLKFLSISTQNTAAEDPSDLGLLLGCMTLGHLLKIYDSHLQNERRKFYISQIYESTL